MHVCVTMYFGVPDKSVLLWGPTLGLWGSTSKNAGRLICFYLFSCVSCVCAVCALAIVCRGLLNGTLQHADIIFSVLSHCIMSIHSVRNLDCFCNSIALVIHSSFNIVAESTSHEPITSTSVIFISSEETAILTCATVLEVICGIV